MAHPTLHDGQPPPPWDVVEFTFSDRDTNVELMILCNKTSFILQATAANFSDSPELEEKISLFPRCCSKL
jgi:hypothetical protein